MSDDSKCGYCAEFLGVATVHCHSCGAVYHVACYAERNDTCSQCGTSAATRRAPAESQTTSHRPISSRLPLAVAVLAGIATCLAIVLWLKADQPIPRGVQPTTFRTADLSCPGTDLAPIEPNLEGRVVSLGTTQSTTLFICNKSNQPITYYWLDFAGKRQRYGMVPAGQSQQQPTFANHIWLLESSTGQVLRIGQAAPGVCRLVIE